MITSVEQTKDGVVIRGTTADTAYYAHIDRRQLESVARQANRMRTAINAPVRVVPLPLKPETKPCPRE